MTFYGWGFVKHLRNSAFIEILLPLWTDYNQTRHQKHIKTLLKKIRSGFAHKSGIHNSGNAPYPYKNHNNWSINWTAHCSYILMAPNRLTKVFLILFSCYYPVFRRRVYSGWSLWNSWTSSSWRHFGRIMDEIWEQKWSNRLIFDTSEISYK